MMTAISGTAWQTNIITVTQSVDIKWNIGYITTTFDESSFPESRYRATYTINTGTEVLKGGSTATQHQSSYHDAVKAKTFHELNHPEKTTKTVKY